MTLPESLPTHGGGVQEAAKQAGVIARAREGDEVLVVLELPPFPAPHQHVLLLLGTLDFF